MSGGAPDLVGSEARRRAGRRSRMASSLAISVLSRRSALLVSGSTGLLALGRGQPARAVDAATLEANKSLVRRVFAEVINVGNAPLLAELYAPKFVNRDVSVWQEPRPAGLPLSLTDFRVALPAVQVMVDSAVAEGDYVAT